MRVFKIVADGAVAFYDELFYFMILGLINFICWILIIPGPFGLASLYTIGQQAVRGKGVNRQIIWDGVKEYGPRSLLLYAIIAAVYVVIGINLWFYITPEISPFPPGVALWTTPFFIFVGVIWTGLTFYGQALLVELQDPRMGQVLKNGLLLTILQPFQTLALLIVALGTLGLSIVLPVLLVVWPGFMACLSLTATRRLMGDLRERALARGGEDPAEEDEEDSSHGRR